MKHRLNLRTPLIQNSRLGSAHKPDRSPAGLGWAPQKLARSLTLLGGLGLLALGACGDRPAPPSPQGGLPSPEASTELETQDPRHTVISGEHSVVHLVTVPPDGAHQLAVAVAEDLRPLADWARDLKAIAAINAGFFDPQNGLTTSFVTLAGEVIADPRQNPRLMENPDLASYREAILNRSEFRIYTCGGQRRHAITPHRAPVPSGCDLTAAVGAGPQLLPVSTGYEEGFLAEDAQGRLVRDTLGSQTPNARSAVGLKADGTVVLAIATQLPTAPTSSGLTLAEFAEVLQQQGVVQALNLDGGSSTGLVWETTAYFGKLDETGAAIERPIKSILWVR